ncbi:armadillo repeat-containing protein 7-like isoform X2 [Gigantopelta aegis]|uniref:armadillo repeat-containing protein 7-like isoform X2 n=1 Tax=Gigantopelta aegis TaxID=1735272 RepID=UPI001B889DDA|nr:armadillo repeat-containing protein 7-like isoform X2 [Gigantopelta aegis]XP_041360228.1 armadillo repeat-containing protein 7-like isoform X2 [Gigantopelta aegis]
MITRGYSLVPKLKHCLTYSDKVPNGKKQILANLANFAYDPINYEYFRKLNILDLFLDALEENDDKLVEFAIGGLCNACLDKQNKDVILKNSGIQVVIKCLSSPNEETVLSAITTLMFLVTTQSKPEITCLPVVECMLRFAEAQNKRLSNLANVFLQDYCSKEQVQAAQEIHQQLISQNALQQQSKDYPP